MTLMGSIHQDSSKTDRSSSFLSNMSESIDSVLLVIITELLLALSLRLTILNPRHLLLAQIQSFVSYHLSKFISMQSKVYFLLDKKKIPILRPIWLRFNYFLLTITNSASKHSNLVNVFLVSIFDIYHPPGCICLTFSRVFS